MTAPIFGAVPDAVRVLEPYVQAGVFGPGEVHLANTLARLAVRDQQRRDQQRRDQPQEPLDDLVILAAAVAARAPRSGHVCVELDDVHRMVVDRRVDAGVDAGPGVDTGAVANMCAELVWPDPAVWAAALVASPVVSDGAQGSRSLLRPLVWDGGRLYLHRLWSDEVGVAAALRARATAMGGHPGRAAAVRQVFGTDPATDRQHQAAQLALEGLLAVVVGGPGTGKTRTVARLLAAAVVATPGVQLALCAPTGKAAARMTDAVQAAVQQLAVESQVSAQALDRLRDAQAVTVHRLLGRRRGGRMRHDRRSPLPHDLVIVDETSMVDLPLMASLLDALRPDAQLVLVGDPDQLASVEAGTVVSDLVAPAPADTPSVLAGRVVELVVGHRFSAGSGIAELADAVRRGDPGAVLALLADGREDVAMVSPEDADAVESLRAAVIDGATDVALRARAGDAQGAVDAARRLKVLAATRAGPWGLYEWSDLIEQGVGERVPELRVNRRWEAGRPFLVTRNDPVARVANGDTGVVVDLHGRLVLMIDTGAGQPVPVPVARLDQVEPWWAMTIHKSQGSEFDHVVVSLPSTDSPVLTRELLYTAVTRARQSVTIVADEATVARAVQRPVSRASGLRDRLR